MKENFGTECSRRIADTEKTPVSVELFESMAIELRGFAGMNCVHINVNHFKMRMLQLSSKFSTLQRDDAVLIDIATVTLHEYAHIRIRQVTRPKHN